MEKIKVLHLFSSFTIGGAEKQTLFTAVNINRLSAEIESLIAAPKNSFLYEQAEKNSVKTFDFLCRGSFTPSGVLKLIKIIKNEKIDILHVHQGKLFWTALFMKMFFKNIKVVLHRRQDTRHKFYAMWHYKIADMTLTVSKAVMNNLIKYEKVPGNKIKVVYNGFDFEKFTKDIDCKDIIEKYDLKDKFVVGTVGAMVSLEGKGQIYLLEALAVLKNKYKNLKCLLVGDGSARQQQQQYAKNLKVDDIAVFTGHQADVAKYLKAMDVFCLLSCGSEGFGNVNLEAQAMGVPVITTNVGGNPETVLNGKTGVVINPRSVDEIVKNLSKFIDEQNYRKNMGMQGQKFVRESFSAQTMVKNLTEVYKNI